MAGGVRLHLHHTRNATQVFFDQPNTGGATNTANRKVCRDGTVRMVLDKILLHRRKVISIKACNWCLGAVAGALAMAIKIGEAMTGYSLRYRLAADAAEGAMLPVDLS